MRLVSRYAPPLPLTDLQELEVKNAMRLKHARGEISDIELQAAIRDFDADLRAGKFQHTPLTWAHVYRQAQNLSAAHTVATFCRTLDILHVAAALVLCAHDFVTFDARQADLAGRAGLAVCQ